MADVVMESVPGDCWPSKLKLLKSQYENSKFLVHQDTIICQKWKLEVDLLLNEEKLHQQAMNVTELSRTVKVNRHKIQAVKEKCKAEKKMLEEKLRVEVEEKLVKQQENHEQERNALNKEIQSLTCIKEKSKAEKKVLEEKLRVEVEEKLAKQQENHEQERNALNKEIQSLTCVKEKSKAEKKVLEEKLRVEVEEKLAKQQENHEQERNALNKEIQSLTCIKEKSKAEKKVLEEKLRVEVEEKLAKQQENHEQERNALNKEIQSLTVVKEKCKAEKKMLEEMLRVEVEEKLAKQQENHEQEKNVLNKEIQSLTDLKEKLGAEMEEMTKRVKSEADDKMKKQEEEYFKNTEKLCQEIKTWKENHQKAVNEAEQLKVELLQNDIFAKENTEEQIKKIKTLTAEADEKLVQQEENSTSEKKQMSLQIQEWKAKHDMVRKEVETLKAEILAKNVITKVKSTPTQVNTQSKVAMACTQFREIGTQVDEELHGDSKVICTAVEEKSGTNETANTLNKKTECESDGNSRAGKKQKKGGRNPRKRGNNEKSKAVQETMTEDLPVDHVTMGEQLPSSTSIVNTVDQKQTEQAAEKPSNEPARKLRKRKNADQELPPTDRPLCSDPALIAKKPKHNTDRTRNVIQDKANTNSSHNSETSVVNDVPNSTESLLMPVVDTVNDDNSQVTKPTNTDHVTNDGENRRKEIDGKIEALKEKNVQRNKSIHTKPQVPRPSVSIRQASSVSDMSSVLNATKKHRTLYNSKENSLMISMLSIQDSFANSTISRGKKASGAMPPSLNAFMKSFVAPKLKKNAKS